MKKLMLLMFATITFTGCGIDDDDARINVIYPLVPIETADMPDTFVAENEYTVELTYQLPTECHTFYDIIAEEQENILFIGVRSMFETENSNCDETDGEITETSFAFTPSPRFESYTFKFWQGEDEDGEAIYLTIEVPVEAETEEDV